MDNFDYPAIGQRIKQEHSVPYRESSSSENAKG